jgi:hypothetical protein
MAVSQLNRTRSDQAVRGASAAKAFSGCEIPRTCPPRKASRPTRKSPTMSRWDVLSLRFTERLSMAFQFQSARPCRCVHETLWPAHHDHAPALARSRRFRARSEWRFILRRFMRSPPPRPLSRGCRALPPSARAPPVGDPTRNAAPPFRPRRSSVETADRRNLSQSGEPRGQLVRHRSLCVQVCRFAFIGVETFCLPPSRQAVFRQQPRLFLDYFPSPC